MTIREARGGDEDAVIRVIKEVYDQYNFSWDSETYHADLYDLERFYWSGGDAFFVAEVDGIVVGTVAYELFKPGSATSSGLPRLDGCDCSIERLYVSSSARNMGVGSSLFRHVVDTLHKLGRQSMEIWSDKRFQEAHRLYERFGAKVVAERVCDDPDESPEYGLILPLLLDRK